MQEKNHVLEAKGYEFEKQINVTQTVSSHLQSMVDAQKQYTRRPYLIINGMAKAGHEKVLIIPTM